MPQPAQAPTPALPPDLFILARDGCTVNLTPLLQTGAKHTVLYAALAKALHIPTKIPSRRENDKLKPYAKHNEFLYRALNHLCKLGLIEKYQNYIDTNSVEPDQRPGLFWRASPAAFETEYLIDGVQNSKCFAQDTSSLSEDKSAASAKHLIPDRCGWLRIQAINALARIRNPALFIRDKETKQLNPELTRRLNNVNNMFHQWEDECSRKVIVLKNMESEDFIEIPYKTRFNDEGRKLKNVKIYNTGIENSLKKHKFGVFLTLTTDPQIWMTPKGEEFKRHVKDGSKTYHFDGTGQGGDLYQANRHESEAWRRWYEKVCHQYGTRIPYIRCVEFQKNGLIHTHVLLFGVTWRKSWAEFAKEWGTKYNQGYLNKAYLIENDGEKWTWKDHKPTDAKNRSPADYLKKYLIKSMYETDGFYMYWACNKRFFTMSESLRYYSLDEKIEEEDWHRENPQPGIFEFVGSAQPEEIPNLIAIYNLKKHGRPKPKYFNEGDPLIPTAGYGVGWLHNASFINAHLRADTIENPDETDTRESEWQTDYEKQLEAERIARAERRRKLREKNK